MINTDFGILSFVLAKTKMLRVPTFYHTNALGPHILTMQVFRNALTPHILIEMVILDRSKELVRDLVGPVRYPHHQHNMIK